MMWRFLATLAVLACGPPVAAQVTNITPDVAPGITLGTTVGQNGPTYTIDGGTTAGTNLFHSFSNFDLGAGDTAAWVYGAGDPNSITSVINRVTGGSPSSIMGTIDSTAIPNADFYFINPAGIVFSGQDAQVNVPAAAYFSTASELHFADGKTFAVATPSGSTLSVAAPQSFGFLGNEGGILVSAIENIDDTPFLANSGTLGLSAAGIAFDNGFIGGNELSLTAVGPVPNTVALDGSTSDPAAGRIDMVNSWLQTWAADCYDFCLGAEGFIILNAGKLSLEFTGIVADFDSSTDEGGTSFVSLTGNRAVDIVDSFILADGYGTASAGDVLIQSNGDVTLIDTLALAYTQGSGAGGLVDIRGNNVVISGGVVGSESYGSGTGGALAISANQQIDIVNDAWLLSTAWDSGNAGTIQLTAPTVQIADSLLSSESFGSGDSGAISVNSTDLVIDNSRITTETFLSGNGGEVTLFAHNATIAGSEISSVSSQSGQAGDVTVHVDGTLLATHSSFTSASLFEGDAGSVSLSGGEAILDDSLLNTSTEGSGDAGLIEVDVRNLTLNDSRIVSFSLFDATGDAGTIDVTADLLTINGDRAYIATSTFGDGNAGDIVVYAGDLQLLDGGAIASRSVGIGTSGDAGSLRITADKILADRGFIDVSTFTAGNGGSITIDTGSLALLNGSRVTSESSDSGLSGSIAITASDILVAEGSRISTNSLYGPAGDILLDMAPGSLLTLEGVVEPGVIETSSGPGTGGVITIASPLAIISNGGSILALGEQGGANVQIDANYFIASSDRPNLVQVNGNLTFSNAIYDVSAGTNDADLEMIDASGVLQGQCSMVRATGEASQLNLRATGPYGAASLPTLSSREGGQATSGGACQ